ncbi:MAG: hypothetical protein JW818_05705 [Pirellulales bacterium]|nr:hypothetical protein [Pirellulales bacterium]
MSTCPWITNGLAAQDWDAAHGWTITTGAALEGTLEIETYYAWVTNAPTDTIGGSSWGGGSAECYGGAHFRVEYKPQGNDPTDIHWIQAIYTNCALDHGKTNGYDAGGGYWEYLDNAETPDTNPFYDNDPPDPATATEFLDIPSRYCPQHECPPCGGTCDWEAQVFIATWDEAASTITVYEDGIWWGFNLSCVPEPSSFIMWGVVATGMIVCRWRPPARGE